MVDINTLLLIVIIGLLLYHCFCKINNNNYHKESDDNLAKIIENYEDNKKIKIQRIKIR